VNISVPGSDVSLSCTLVRSRLCFPLPLLVSLSVSKTPTLTLHGEAITAYVGRILEMRKLLVLADADTAPSDLSVKQVILKGLPVSVDAIKVPKQPTHI
jgi:hypothetical protein